MADSNSLKVMCLFEVAARMNYSSELVCLAAHVYHRFFRIKYHLNQYDLYTFACASLQLAHMFYELPFDHRQLCIVMSEMVHGPGKYMNESVEAKLRHSIELAAKVIFTCLDQQINYKDTHQLTPGMLQQHYRNMEAEQAGRRKVPTIEINFSDDEEKSSSSEEEDEEDALERRTDRLLSKNDKYRISSHRYLVHYLKTIKQLVNTEVMDIYIKISNLAWVFLNDYHWTPCVTQIYSNHLACACLMMAIEIYRPKLAESRNNDRKELWKLLNKKWNLILCDDFNSRIASKAMIRIVEQYQEYDRVQQHELNLFVIDPLRR